MLKRQNILDGVETTEELNNNKKTKYTAFDKAVHYRRRGI